jgi:18S rRNA (guanine1575-N7)-methyltransferase
MKRSAKAVLQFYPESPEQALLIAQSASKVGFAGGVVVDYPNSAKAKKHYLCLSFERSYRVPTAIGTGTESNVDVIGRERMISHRKSKRSDPRRRDWIEKKKERRRAQGKEVKSDSKFTGRKRHERF